MAKYIDLRCDFGFKYCMSDPVIMMSFLNAILDGDVETITDVSFENVEYPGENSDQRGVVFDLHCTTQSGDSILIEMQNSCQKFFKTRANYYVYKLLDSKIDKGLVWKDMKEDISRIIGIFIMGETMSGIKKVITRTGECDLDSGELFWDRHRKYFVNLQKFKFDGGNITLKNIWLYSFKNLGDMENIDPSVYEKADEGLKRLIERAKVGALSKKDYAAYEASLKKLADEIDMEEHGFERGLEQGFSLAIQKMHKGGMAISEISKVLNINEEEITQILSNS